MTESEPTKRISRRKMLGFLTVGATGGAIIGIGGTVGIRKLFFEQESNRLPKELKIKSLEFYLKNIQNKDLSAPLDQETMVQAFNDIFDEIYKNLSENKKNSPYRDLKTSDMTMKVDGPIETWYYSFRKETDQNDKEKTTRTLIMRHWNQYPTIYYTSTNGQITKELTTDQNTTETKILDANDLSYTTSSLITAYECFAIDYNHTGGCK